MENVKLYRKRITQKDRMDYAYKKDKTHCISVSASIGEDEYSSEVSEIQPSELKKEVRKLMNAIAHASLSQ